MENQFDVATVTSGPIGSTFQHNECTIMIVDKKISNMECEDCYFSNMGSACISANCISINRSDNTRVCFKKV